MGQMRRIPPHHACMRTLGSVYTSHARPCAVLTLDSGIMAWHAPAQEFVSAAMNRSMLEKKDLLMAAFNKFDTNGDGLITFSGLKKVGAELGWAAGASCRCGCSLCGVILCVRLLHVRCMPGNIWLPGALVTLRVGVWGDSGRHFELHSLALHPIKRPAEEPHSTPHTTHLITPQTPRCHP